MSNPVQIMYFVFLLYVLHSVKCFKPIMKIVAGFDCHPRIVPYLASLQDEHHRIFCGGSVLHSYWAMSAAHCCKASEHLGYKIYTGLVEDISKWDEGVQSVRVKRMIPHRKFATVPWSSDICLVELAEPLKQNEHMKFVRIPTPFIYQQLMDKKLCNMSLAMGFGYRGVVFENGTAMPTHNLENRMLQCVFQRIMNDEYCEQGSKGIDYSTTLCTRGAPIVTADTCRGDSGGPLICHGFQFGIVAAGIGCGLGHRSYFTKVAPFYQDFILKHVPLNESDGTLLQHKLSICILSLYIFHIVIREYNKKVIIF